MDYNKAINILDLKDEFTEQELKHNYYLKALQYHPDKNDALDANEKFQKVLDAYIFLKKYKNIYNSGDGENEMGENEMGENEMGGEKCNSYTKILEQFINGILNKNIDANNFLSILNNKCSEISIEILQHFSKDTLLKLHLFVSKYSDILHINEDIIQRLELLIKDYTKNDTILVINPSLENLINDEIYKLDFENETYYIPTWHNELVYDIIDISNNTEKCTYSTM